MVSTTVLWMPWTLIETAVASYTPEAGYRLERYDDSPGLYFEGLGQAMLYDTVWKAIVYVQLKPMRQTTATEQYADYINKLCTSLDFKGWTLCSHLDDLTFSKLQQAKEYRPVSN